MTLKRFVKLGGRAVDLRAYGDVAPPVMENDTIPAITGSPIQGQTLTASTGAWTPTPDWVTYQWRRNNGAIPGAVTAGYTVQAADLGQDLTVVVTAHKSGHVSASAQSAAVNVPTAEPSPGLFFALPDTSDSPKLSLAHYYPPMPRTFNNSQNDAYTTAYLPVNGEGGIHASFGGWVRNRPMTDAPYPNPYIETMHRRCIEDAIAGGIDGFFVDILGASGPNWDRLVGLAKTASNEYPGFWIVPMLDCNGTTATSQTNAVIAARIAHFANRPSAYYLPNGRYLISGYRTVFNGVSNANSATKWQQIFDLLASNHGLSNPALVGVFNNWQAQYTGGAFNGKLYAAGRWAIAADPQVWAQTGDTAALVRSRGEKYLAPIWAQDMRPRDHWFDEARNTGSLRESWNRAIADDADLVQICTWSDFTEGSAIMSNVKAGHAWIDVSAWWQSRWKTGVFPPILRDAMYVSHRNQMANATITGGQSTFMTHRSVGNRSTFREHVEILTFFTAPATVSVKIGSTTYNYTAPAGMNVQTYAMAPGEVSAKAVRSSVEIARVNSPVVIKSTAANDDREYCIFSSLRGTAGQYDPTPGSPSPNPANYIT